MRRLKIKRNRFLLWAVLVGLLALTIGEIADGIAGCGSCSPDRNLCEWLIRCGLESGPLKKCLQKVEWFPEQFVRRCEGCIRGKRCRAFQNCAKVCDLELASKCDALSKKGNAREKPVDSEEVQVRNKRTGKIYEVRLDHLGQALLTGEIEVAPGTRVVVINQSGEFGTIPAEQVISGNASAAGMRVASPAEIEKELKRKRELEEACKELGLLQEA